ncbi:PA2169 family four-helix-bundle protein [Hymenobacter algoricola]|uniref:PA2169 family four-helix-bundle protein n=1 Tax=Hymenobacter algoricola TaxID=486267 RepID=A0ABP7NAW7_9BACT
MALITGETARIYNDLVVINKAAIKGYLEAAEAVSNPDLKAELLRYSEQRTRFAEELEAQAIAFGVEPPSEESTVEGAVTDAVAAMHRGWINLKSSIIDREDKVILSECENGDAAALMSYELALQSEDLVPAALALLRQQQGEIQLIKNKFAARRSQPGQ